MSLGSNDRSSLLPLWMHLATNPLLLCEACRLCLLLRQITRKREWKSYQVSLLELRNAASSGNTRRVLEKPLLTIVTAVGAQNESQMGAK